MKSVQDPDLQNYNKGQLQQRVSQEAGKSRKDGGVTETKRGECYKKKGTNN